MDTVVPNGERKGSLRSRFFPPDEGGFIAVWIALTITVLLAFAGFAIDLGNWYLQIQRTQRAADAAALDGDALLPGNVTLARQAAYQALLNNKVDLADANAALANSDCSGGNPCIAPVAGEPTQMEVRLGTTVTNVFLRFVGVSTTKTFVREAIADHRTGLHMNTGKNGLGGPEPDDGSGLWMAPDAVATDNNYWINISGGGASKVGGDRFSSKVCNNNPGAQAALNPRDGCSGNTNDEYGAENYNFIIHVAAASGTGYLQIEGYDPGYNKDPGCATDGSDPKCPADEYLYSSSDIPWSTPGNLPTTYFNLYKTATDTVPMTACYSFAPILSGTPKWELVCPSISIDLSQENEYVLRVTTNDGVGINHFQLRVGVTSGGSPASMDAAHVALSQSIINVAADKSMSIFDNTDGIANFRMAQIPTEWAGRTIHFQFYDAGDQYDASGSGGPVGTISLDGDVDGPKNFLSGNCEYSPPASPLTSLVPAGSGPTGCGVTVDEPHFNGQTLQFNWNVPASYSCTIVGTTNCWLYVHLDMDGVVIDDTTWSLLEPEMPLRLVR